MRRVLHEVSEHLLDGRSKRFFGEYVCVFCENEMYERACVCARSPDELSLVPGSCV